MAVLTIGDQFPAYGLTAVVPDNLKEAKASRPENHFTTVSSQVPAGTWRIIFFWPKDFTFVCPTEVAAFDNLYWDFKDRDREAVGVSMGSGYTHYAWRHSHNKLQDLPFPMASDLDRELTEALGIKHAIGETNRATFIIDPRDIIQSVSVTTGSVGRSTEEILRQLDVLRSDELCVCNWQADAATVNALGRMS